MYTCPNLRVTGVRTVVPLYAVGTLGTCHLGEPLRNPFCLPKLLRFDGCTAQAVAITLFMGIGTNARARGSLNRQIGHVHRSHLSTIRVGLVGRIPRDDRRLFVEGDEPGVRTITTAWQLSELFQSLSVQPAQRHSRTSRRCSPAANNPALPPLRQQRTTDISIKLNPIPLRPGLI